MVDFQLLARRATVEAWSRLRSHPCPYLDALQKRPDHATKTCYSLENYARTLSTRRTMRRGSPSGSVWVARGGSETLQWSSMR